MPDAKPTLSAEDLIPDGALPDSTLDSLDHDAIASVVGNLARTVETPANIALFGPWGSGKSSLYSMIKTCITDADPAVAVVKYDAWKFGGSMLQRNFLFDVANQLDISTGKFLRNLNDSTESVRLRLGKFLWRNAGSLLLAMGIAVAIATIYVAGMAVVASIGQPTWRKEALRLIPSGVGVFGLIIAALVFSNQTLASAVEKRSRSPLQDADQFSGAFNDLMKAALDEKKDGTRVSRLVVFIDELDRCSPKDVVATLISLKTFLDHKDCVFVVAADRDVVREALDEAPQAKPVRENEPYYSTAGAFIDKIFQHQISLPPVRAEALADFAMGLANRQAGLWKELREKDQRAYEDVVYALVPAHVQSPRRVKILMNNFATTFRVIQAREMERKPEPSEVAVLTVLQTEFPALIQDLVQEPRLVEALVDSTYAESETASENLRALVAAYSPEAKNSPQKSDEEPPTTTRSPAGELMSDSETADSAKIDAARLKLNQQLDGYLAYIHGAGIPFPTLDLVYLQDAASVQGLTDPELRQLVDVAHAYAVDTIADRFESAAVSDKQAAIQFFATKANTTFGAARANLVELACRITEMLDLEDIESIAHDVAPTVLGEVRSGRWRDSATPGALLLGLLDPQSEPLDRLGDYANAATLVEHNVFDRILPVLPLLDDARAHLLHTMLLSVYPEHPEPLHHAVATLSTNPVERLWGDIGEGVLQELRELPIETSGVTPAATVVAPQRAQAVEEAPEVLAPARYRDLLTAFARRSQRADHAAAAVLIYGIEAQQAVYETVYEVTDELLDAVIVDSKMRNDVALAGLASGAAGNDSHWTTHLDSTSEADPQRVSEALERLCDDCASDTERPEHKALLGAVDAVARWATEEDAEGGAVILLNALLATPFSAQSDPDSAKRDLAYRILQALSPALAEGRIEAIRLQDLEHALDANTDLSMIVEPLLAQVVSLEPDTADRLDARLAGTKPTSPDFINLTRLRVQARATAGKQPLRAQAFLSQVNDDVAATSLVTEWLGTNPPLRDVHAVVKKATLTPNTLGNYAAKRSLSDRSRLWITARTSGFTDNHLRAIGRHGVDATVVEHMSPEILAADLKMQRPLIDTLLTGHLASDPAARRAASTLALALLNTGKAGAGQSAARLVIDAGGAGRNLTQLVRAAFDAFTVAHPNSINRGDLRRLDSLKLITKKKSNPLAAFFGWR